MVVLHARLRGGLAGFQRISLFLMQCGMNSTKEAREKHPRRSDTTYMIQDIIKPLMFKQTMRGDIAEKELSSKQAATDRNCTWYTETGSYVINICLLFIKKDTSSLEEGRCSARGLRNTRGKLHRG